MITSTEITNDCAVTSYPYLGEYTPTCLGKRVVLFVKENTGTLVYCSTDEYQVGEYRTDWLEDVFVPSTNTIQLTNKKM